jgi:hypothetical protein
MTGQCHTKKPHYKEKGTIEYEIVAIEKTLRVYPSQVDRRRCSIELLGFGDVSGYLFWNICHAAARSRDKIIDVKFLPGCTTPRLRHDACAKVQWFEILKATGKKMRDVTRPSLNFNVFLIHLLAFSHVDLMFLNVPITLLHEFFSRCVS